MDPLSAPRPSPLATPATPTARSYLDFDGLGQLKGQARQNAKSATRETAQQFEALFIQMMMKSMREASVKSDLSESSGKDTFEGMFDREVSVQMAKRNTLGVADMLVKAMTPAEVNPASTAAMLQARLAGAAPGLPMQGLQGGQTKAKGVSLQAPGPTALPLQRPGPMLLHTSPGLLDGKTL